MLFPWTLGKPLSFPGCRGGVPASNGASSWVQTDLGNYGAVALGFEQAETPIEESVGGMVKVFNAATRESAGGKFWLYTGEEKPW